MIQQQTIYVPVGEETKSVLYVRDWDNYAYVQVEKQENKIVLDITDLKVIKEARDTLVMASLIDKSDTCKDMVEKLDYLIKHL